VFIVSHSLEEAYPALVHKWFGIHHRLHIDSSVELKYIDGYYVKLIPTSKPHTLNIESNYRRLDKPGIC